MLTLYLTAVDSRYATVEELEAANIRIEELPPHFRRDDGKGLMAHQAHTIAALRSPDTPIVINTAKTGDGKSFIGQYLTFVRERSTMTLYPTNELAKDQQRSLNALKLIWNDGGIQRIRYDVLNATTLDEVESRLFAGTRPRALEALMTKELVLTNPDIFHLLLQFRYRTPGAAPDHLLKKVAERFGLFVFDEFHIFSTPQAVSAMIALLTLLEITAGTKNGPRFLFLSATDKQLIGHLARLAGLPVSHIEGQYEYGKPTPAPDRRRIMQPVTLWLYERGEGGLEAWIDANIDRIIRFFREHPEARGVILCNSVATAFRVHARLDQPCDAAGIKLGNPNTGLTPPEARRIDGQLVVATSTIDVGVDFKINFLVFESTDDATHVQRLGRLGRHQHNASDEPFSTYEAHALLPSWVVQDMAKTLQDGATVDRDRYEETLRNSYKPLQEFQQYRVRWGGVQAASVLAAMSTKEIRVEYKETRMQLFDQFQRLFPKRMLHPNYLLELRAQTPEICQEAASFRGTSPFTALVINDMLGEDAATGTAESVMPYNLITLLLQARLERLSLDEAYRRAGDRAEALRKTDPLIAYRVVGWLPQKPRKVSILLNEPTRSWPSEYFGTVIEQGGFRFEVEPNDIPELRQLNEMLEARTLVALLIRPGDLKRLDVADPATLRLYFRLGMSLELFSFRSQDSASQGCVAFGRDALLLDSIIYQSRSDNNEPMYG